jgi:hypothetical protein
MLLLCRVFVQAYVKYEAVSRRYITLHDTFVWLTLYNWLFGKVLVVAGLCVAKGQ